MLKKIVYSGKIIVEHLSEFLSTDQLQMKIKSKRNNKQIQNLSLLKVATQVPCQVIRPAKYSPAAIKGDSLLRDLLAASMITTVKYPFETFCCGSSILPYDEEIALKIAKQRINSLIKHKVDAIIMGCGNCSMNYTVYQNEYSEIYLPALFFTEILAYALGEENAELDVLIEKRKH